MTHTGPRVAVYAFVAFVLAAAAPIVAAETLNVPPAGFTALFNGTDLTGWFGHETQDPRSLWAMAPDALEAHKEKTRADLRAHWCIEQGVLINDGNGLYATTNKDYGDFELLLEYKTVAKADSGIYLRGVPQVQIWDYTKEGGKWDLGADKGSGGLWNNSPGARGKDPLVLADKPFGEWNYQCVTVKGSTIVVELNGTRVLDADLSKVTKAIYELEKFQGRDRTKGSFGFAGHGDPVVFRAIELKKL